MCFDDVTAVRTWDWEVGMRTRWNVGGHTGASSFFWQVSSVIVSPWCETGQNDHESSIDEDSHWTGELVLFRLSRVMLSQMSTSNPLLSQILELFHCLKLKMCWLSQCYRGNMSSRTHESSGRTLIALFFSLIEAKTQFLNRDMSTQTLSDRINLCGRFTDKTAMIRTTKYRHSICYNHKHIIRVGVFYSLTFTLLEFPKRKLTPFAYNI